LVWPLLSLAMFYHPCLMRVAASFLALAALLPARAAVLQAQQLAEKREVDRQQLIRRESPQATAATAPKGAVGELVGSQGPPEPVNIVIHCQEDLWRLQRFQKHMDAEGLKFEVFPCIHLNKTQFEEAVESLYFGPGAFFASGHRSGALAVALAHMKLLQSIVDRGLPAANIFEDDEVPLPGYKIERAKILGSLPSDAEFVQLNALRPWGKYVAGTDERVRKTGKSANFTVNVWLSNYYVSAAGAKKILPLMRHFDMGPNTALEIDWWLANAISSGCSLCKMSSWVVNASNKISAHCQNLSTKEPANKRGLKFLTVTDEPPTPEVCYEMIPDPNSTLSRSNASALTQKSIHSP